MFIPLFSLAALFPVANLGTVERDHSGPLCRPNGHLCGNLGRIILGGRRTPKAASRSSPHDTAHPPQLLQGGGLPRENPETLALAKRNRSVKVKVHLHCSAYIKVWDLESGRELCYSGCTSCGQCRCEPDSP